MSTTEHSLGFFVGDGQLLTLDDDLMGSRSEYMPVKILSTRKAYKECQSSDVVADALFRITICSRFHRRQEPQVESVKHFFEAMKKSRGEQSTKSSILIADLAMEGLQLFQ